jgi:hypothetical protein
MLLVVVMLSATSSGVRMRTVGAVSAVLAPTPSAGKAS